MAHTNTIDGNLFVGSGDMRMDFARCRDYTIRDNVLDCPGSLELRLAPDGASALAGNDFGTGKGVTLVTLDQYSETGRRPLDPAGNEFSHPRIRQVRKRVWEVTTADGKTRVWDMSRVGPR